MNNQNEDNSKPKKRMPKSFSVTFDTRPNFFLPRQRAASLHDESGLANFYSNSTILITGGTGFIGKAIIEKLLRTFEDISRIYILVRPKRGQTVEERCQDLFKGSVFDRLRAEGTSEKLLSKVTGIPGDICEPHLGISEEHLQTLINSVTIVFHSAATIKFNEPLATATKLNIWGTQRVIFVCRKLRKLKALIHVSTAYSNADKEKIVEAVYPIPELQKAKHNTNEILPMELVEQIGKKMVQTHPNTYTLTKAIAELIVYECTHDLPVGIVRPSIVTASWREPFEGWIDNVSGTTGILLGGYLGLISSLLGGENLVLDMIPVDIVVNTLVVSAYYVSSFSSDVLKVFNCTSGSINPITLQQMCVLLMHYSLKMPSIHVQWYPNLTIRMNKFKHSVHQRVCQYLPALLVDSIRPLIGYKTGLTNSSLLHFYNKFRSMAKPVEYFCTHQFNFACENIQILQESLRHPFENEHFFMDVSTINWDTYMKNYIYGIRKYVLKDSDDSMPQAKRKLRRLYWLRKGVQLVLILLIYTIIF